MRWPVVVLFCCCCCCCVLFCCCCVLLLFLTRALFMSTYRRDELAPLKRRPPTPKRRPKSAALSGDKCSSQPREARRSSVQFSKCNHRDEAKKLKHRLSTLLCENGERTLQDSQEPESLPMDSTLYSSSDTQTEHVAKVEPSTAPQTTTASPEETKSLHSTSNTQTPDTGLPGTRPRGNKAPYFQVRTQETKEKKFFLRPP